MDVKQRDKETDLTSCDKLTPSRLGFGASGVWGKRWFSARKAEHLIAYALERGITHFDTAGFYAGGEAERRLGQALKAHQGYPLTISSKTGTIYRPGRAPLKDFSPKTIRADVMASLNRLNRDRIDILYLHGPNKGQIKSTSEVLCQLKQEGKIGAIGVCGQGGPLLFAAKQPHIDVIMGAFNAFSQGHAECFRLAKTCKKKVVAIASMGQALYRKGFYRPKSFADIWYIARALARKRGDLIKAQSRPHDLLASFQDLSAPAAMLAFTLSQADIDMAMINTTRLAHLQENLDVAQNLPLDARIYDRLAALAST